MNRTVAAALAAITLAMPIAGCSMAHHHLAGRVAQTASAPTTYDLRDGTAEDMAVWIRNPNVHAFYQATVDAFAQGPDHLDRAAYERRAHEIFDDLAVSMHVPPAALQDHLKLIPGQMVQIVKRDPHALDSYDSFIVALFGPQQWSAQAAKR